MKRKLLHLLIPLLAIPSALRADEHALIISFHDGDPVEVILADKPCATFVGDELWVESDNFYAAYKRSAIAGFHFGWATTTSHGMHAERLVQIIYTDNDRVELRGIAPTSMVGVCGLDGRRLSTSLIPTSEGIIIDLTAYPAGIYLININNTQTFKLPKQ